MPKTNPAAVRYAVKPKFRLAALSIQFVLLGLFILLILGCQTAESTTEISQQPTATQPISTTPAENTATPSPTATAAPLPTATLEPTATINKMEIALSATPLPSPTACPLPDVAAALDHYAAQESYKMQITLRFGDSSTPPTYIIDLFHMPGLDQYEVWTTQHVDTIAGEQDVVIHDFVMADIVYRSSNDEAWEAFRGPLAHEEVTGVWLLKAFTALLQSPLPAPDAGQGCGLNGRYEFSDIDITSSEIYTAVNLAIIDTIDIVNFSLGIDPTNGALQFASVDFNPYTETWLQLDLFFIEQEEPITIELPENLPEPSFIYEVPLPQDGELALEGSDFLVYATNLSLDDAIDFYVSELKEFGWTIQSTNIEDEKVEFFLENDEAVLVLLLQNRLPGLFQRETEEHYIFFIVP